MSATVFVPAARSMPPRRGRFRSKVDAFQRANRVYVCTECGRWHTTKVTHCTECDMPAIQHFASTGEAKRYAHLRLLQSAGHISRLECQPRFNVPINGGHLCAYVADFRYLDRDGCTVVEDCKGSTEYQDDASKLRRRAAELHFAMNVRIVT